MLSRFLFSSLALAVTHGQKCGIDGSNFNRCSGTGLPYALRLLGCCIFVVGFFLLWFLLSAFRFLYFYSFACFVASPLSLFCLLFFCFCFVGWCWFACLVLFVSCSVCCLFSLVFEFLFHFICFLPLLPVACLHIRLCRP